MGLKVYVRQIAFVCITGGKQFCLNLHVHLHVALVISHRRSYCLAKENPLLVDITLCFSTYLCGRRLAVQPSSKWPPHLAPSFSFKFPYDGNDFTVYSTEIMGKAGSV